MPLLDPHERPPDLIRSLYKHYQKLPDTDLDEDHNLISFKDSGEKHVKADFHLVHTIDRCLLHLPLVLSDILNAECSQLAFVYESAVLPGLHIIPSLISEDLQIELLSRLFHRDLANTKHQTNLHKHYRIPYKLTENLSAGDGQHRLGHASFFNTDPSSKEPFEPLDPAIHKPLTISQVLNKKLRWITLGGQYDWTNKKYPDDASEHPEFPGDIAAIVHRAFPDMNPEAAIINLYSPGDTLSLHRDVSEESNEGLVSLSIGCDAVFVVGVVDTDGDKSRSLAIRLSSGDAIYMSGASRYAWHGVPRIMASTCPLALQNWPALDPDRSASQSDDVSSYEAWRGWMKTKRINLNIRQMRPHIRPKLSERTT